MATPVISTYAPTLTTNEDYKDEFFDALEWVLQKAHSSDKIFLWVISMQESKQLLIFG